MIPTVTPATTRALFAVGSEAKATHIVDLLNECLPEGENAVTAFERDDSGFWDISVHFAELPDQAAFRNLVALCAGDEIADQISFETIEAKDWVKESLEGLAPVPAGRFMVHGQHDRSRVPYNKISIEIEAALAFGTGHHGTTRGCLLLLDKVLRRRQPKRILDLGSGTGVLAIAAAKATRRKVLASDIDPQATRVAKDNARLNGVVNLVETVTATGFGGPHFRKYVPFDLVLANILANPLRELATPMARHLAPSGYVILSGLLPHQATSVITAYRSRGLILHQHQQIDGWSSLLMQRVN